MIDEELLSKFDRIQDLPVSEELLGAYYEGKTTPSESLSIQSSISYDYSLQNILSNLSQDQDNSNNYSFDGEIDFPQDSFFTDVFENIESMKDLTRSYNTIGEDAQNMQDPVYVLQPDDHSCALRSQQIVLRDFGIDIPFDKLEELAKSYGVYSDDGTYTYDIGKVLQIAGVGMHQVQGTSFYDLTNELAQGHRVIVSVDADELWRNDPYGKLKNWFNDAIGAQGGNHALIVAGVEVNPLDSKDVKVVLTDPGAGHLRVEYPLDQFMDAWKDSKCFMAATNAPAPYQYDPETGMEVPSNFMVERFVNDFIANNGYQLAPDLINIPEEYQPSFTGNIDMVGNLTFDEWEDQYDNMVNSRMPSSLSIKEQIESSARDNALPRENYEKQDEHKVDFSINEEGNSPLVSDETVTGSVNMGNEDTGFAADEDGADAEEYGTDASEDRSDADEDEDSEDKTQKSYGDIDNPDDSDGTDYSDEF